MDLTLANSNFTFVQNIPAWSEKSFTKQISPEIGRLNKLKTLDLANNQLRGPIPDVLGNLKELEILHLDGNLLSETIPPTLGGCKKLEELHLDRNKLQGCKFSEDTTS